MFQVVNAHGLICSCFLKCKNLLLKENYESAQTQHLMLFTKKNSFAIEHSRTASSNIYLQTVVQRESRLWVFWPSAERSLWARQRKVCSCDLVVAKVLYICFWEIYEVFCGERSSSWATTAKCLYVYKVNYELPSFWYSLTGALQMLSLLKCRSIDLFCLRMAKNSWEAQLTC